ncbi:kinesin-related protein 10 [Drosophila grimshawi]|uniref:GH15576 n=1 Tax=Drosophila grimshawi TaxID=7222 RepID=B4J0X4_DROGR|nr:kinesin-related protein 10 [Drosophila grimshawi]EDV95795.1 GH15576 [Drosophila grimshawi]
MFIKFVVFCVIVDICAANNLDHYNYGSMDGTTSTERINAAMRCVNVNPQNSVDLEQIMGLWYGSEIIMHSQDFPGVYEYDSCVIIHLTDVTQQVRNNNNYNNNRGYNTNYNNRNQNNYGHISTTPQYYLDNDDHVRQPPRTKYLRLVWSERDNNLEYTFNYTADAPGQWSNIGDQRGSLVQLNSYTQFTGTVQVVKAVNDHLVLTFCGNDVKSSIYTVVLTRNRLGLSTDELRSIRSMLSRRGLYSETIRKVCSGAPNVGGGLLSLLSLLLLAAWGRCH